jgi:anaerobic dimethyl sulfoxide reductase subunit B (iron-sulfur subunit)
MTQYGFFIDLSRCIGCNACTIACKEWHNLEPGPVKWMRVYQWRRVFSGYRSTYSSHDVMHCQNPVCAEACPNHAISKDEKYGAVIVDPAKCTGKTRMF